MAPGLPPAVMHPSAEERGYGVDDTYDQFDTYVTLCNEAGDRLDIGRRDLPAVADLLLRWHVRSKMGG